MNINKLITQMLKKANGDAIRKLFETDWGLNWPQAMLSGSNKKGRSNKSPGHTAAPREIPPKVGMTALLDYR